MSTGPRISVIMPVWAPQESHFRKAVESVLQQSISDWELVIVEDPSDVDLAAWLTKYNDPRIRLFRNLSRTSLIQQRNRTLVEAQGEFVAILDADDVCEPQRLEQQLDFMIRNPAIDIVGSQITIIDGDDKPIGCREYPQSHAAISDALRRYNPLAHSTIFCRRELLIDCGGYQYDGVEDYELWRRLAQRGAKFQNLPDALVQYRVQPQQMKSRRLLQTIQGTLDIKRQYWDDGMDLPARLRYALETGLQWLPAKLVMWLFIKTQYRKLS